MLTWCCKPFPRPSRQLFPLPGPQLGGGDSQVQNHIWHHPIASRHALVGRCGDLKSLLLGSGAIGCAVDFENQHTRRREHRSRGQIRGPRHEPWDSPLTGTLWPVCPRNTVFGMLGEVKKVSVSAQWGPVFQPAEDAPLLFLLVRSGFFARCVFPFPGIRETQIYHSYAYH